MRGWVGGYGSPLREGCGNHNVQISTSRTSQAYTNNNSTRMQFKTIQMGPGREWSNASSHLTAQIHYLWALKLLSELYVHHYILGLELGQMMILPFKASFEIARCNPHNACD